MSPHLLSSAGRLAGASLLRVQSDERLVALVRTGHDPAFAAMDDRYRADLLRYATRLVGEDRAEDVVQQAFVNAHVALTTSAYAVTLRPWLYRIVHNAALNVLRAGHRESELDDNLAARTSLEDEHDVRERLGEALAVIALLPQPQRDALTLQALEQRSHAEIAAALGVSPGAARQHLHRARSTVRAAVTAATPYGLLARLVPAGGSGGEMLTGGLAGAGAAATLAKVGAGVLAAGALVGAGASHVAPHHHHHAAGGGASASAVVAHPSAKPSAAVIRPAVAAAHGSRVSTPPERRGGHGHRARSTTTPDRHHGAFASSGSTVRPSRSGAGSTSSSGPGRDGSSGSDDVHSGTSGSSGGDRGSHDVTQLAAGTSGESESLVDETGGTDGGTSDGSETSGGGGTSGGSGSSGGGETSGGSSDGATSTSGGPSATATSTDG